MSSTRDFLPNISYLSKDFFAIVDDLNAYIQENYKDFWNDFTQSNLGEALVDLLAYIGDQLNFYLDKRVNNMYWDTVSRYDSILRLCRLIGYYPTGAVGSRVNVVARRGGINSYVEYPSYGSSNSRYFLVRGGHWGETPNKQTFIPGQSIIVGDLVFEVLEDTKIYNSLPHVGDIELILNRLEHEVKDNDHPSTVYDIIQFFMYQGQTVQDTFVSDGSAFQIFETSRGLIIDSSWKFCINNVGHDDGEPGGTSSSDGWIQATDNTFVKHVAGSHVYTIDYINDEKIRVKFGDGSDYGAIPLEGSTITISYRIGGGFNSNIISSSIKALENNVFADLYEYNPIGDILITSNINIPINNDSYFLESNNTSINDYGGKGQYGADKESIDNIKIRAPSHLSSTNRAITKLDIQTLVSDFRYYDESSQLTYQVSKVSVSRVEDVLRYVDYDPDSPTFGCLYSQPSDGRTEIKYEGQAIPIYVPSYGCNIIQIYVWQLGNSGEDVVADDILISALRDYLNRGTLFSTDTRLGDIGMTSVYYSVNKGSFQDIIVNLNTSLSSGITGVSYDPVFKKTGTSSLDSQINTAISNLFLNKEPGIKFSTLSVWRAISSISGILDFTVTLNGSPSDVIVTTDKIARLALSGGLVFNLVSEV
jgi:hypothetical protein